MWAMRRRGALDIMSDRTYTPGSGRPLVWLHGAVKTPPFGLAARMEAGLLLRRLQDGEIPAFPHSRPLPGIGPRCRELRVHDRSLSWRIIVAVEPDAIVVLEVFAKRTRAIPQEVLETCRRRLGRYLQAVKGGRLE
jgi:phage-related protein